MQEPITLEYASARSWWTRRRKVRLALTLAAVVAVSYLGYQGYREIRRRMTLLDKDPFIGPVDWWAIARSRTLLGHAWRLSSDPLQARRIVAGHASDPRVEVVSEFARSADVEVDLERTVEFADDGTLRLHVMVANNSSKPAVVAPLRLRASTSSLAGRGACVTFVGRHLLIGPAEWLRSITIERRMSGRFGWRGAGDFDGSSTAPGVTRDIVARILTEAAPASGSEWPFGPASEFTGAGEVRLFWVRWEGGTSQPTIGETAKFEALAPPIPADRVAVELSNRGAALLASGVRLLQPGQTARLPVSVSGIGANGCGIIFIHAYRMTLWVVIEDGAGQHWGKTEQRAPQGTLTAPYLPWPDAMLTPDEAQPKPWERLPNP